MEERLKRLEAVVARVRVLSSLALGAVLGYLTRQLLIACGWI